MLKLVVDLKGILFLYLTDNPTDNIRPEQLESIYAKTKSEAERIVEKSHITREASDVSIEGQVKIANRLSQLDESENERLDLHMVTVDAAHHVVKVQHEKEAIVAKEQKQVVHYQNRLQNQIDHETYTIKRLVSLIGVDFSLLESVIRQLVQMDQVILEDFIENIVDNRSRSRMSSKEKQKLLEYCEKYKGNLFIDSKASNFCAFCSYQPFLLLFLRCQRPHKSPIWLVLNQEYNLLCIANNQHSL